LIRLICLEFILKLAFKSLGLAVTGILLSGCVSSVLDVPVRGEIKVPSKLIAQMNKKSMSNGSPVLIRIFKQESELELWKVDKTGKYALLKTYPMCRWSGKLGPKKKSGDRQAPEGFYHVSTALLNPNSAYYLSFNLGYPNRLERALGYTGDAMMVHGACSSAGCFAITDEQVAEVYAVVRDALRRGQKNFQVQAYPFRMTKANMARHRGNENYAFWRDLKHGYDIFERTRQQPHVGYCEGRYMFGEAALSYEGKSPLAACADDSLVSAIASERTIGMEAAISMEESFDAEQAPAPLAYEDGGMHISFRNILENKGHKHLAEKTSVKSVPVSRPKAALADPHTPED
jgi:murein L,D-transpeptidase YafK